MFSLFSNPSYRTVHSRSSHHSFGSARCSVLPVRSGDQNEGFLKKVPASIFRTYKRGRNAQGHHTGALKEACQTSSRSQTLSTWCTKSWSDNRSLKVTSWWKIVTDHMTRIRRETKSSLNNSRKFLDHALVLIEDYNSASTYSKSNMVRCKQSERFLECFRSNF